MWHNFFLSSLNLLHVKLWEKLYENRVKREREGENNQASEKKVEAMWKTALVEEQEVTEYSNQAFLFFSYFSCNWHSGTERREEEEDPVWKAKKSKSWGYCVYNGHIQTLYIQAALLFVLFHIHAKERTNERGLWICFVFFPFSLKAYLTSLLCTLV